MQNDRPSLPEQPNNDKPDIINIACIIGWAIILGDILFAFLPTMRHFLFRNHPWYVIASIGLIDILYIIAFWLIWKMRVIGVWLYSFTFACMLCAEYFYSISFYISIVFGIALLIIFLTYYREMQ